MAAITLPGFTFGSALGMGAFEGIGTAFTGAKSSSSGLSEALGALKSKIDLAAVAAKVETAQEQEKKAEKIELSTLKRGDRKSTRLNSSHKVQSRMPSSA